ncbi:MAG TPA: HD domain-containing protein [Thermodesulfobacteriaceae bacterium]|nr:HD domain-containing protein [Thermodesulfobacteriaceae bacterium]
MVMRPSVLQNALASDYSIAVKLPDRQQCMGILREHQVPEHIIEHCTRVAQVGVFLASSLNRSGGNLRLDLIETAGLLHDITKVASIHSREDHAVTGCNLLISLGFHSVARVVRQHVRLDRNTVFGSAISEAMVVNYADKRVNHSTIVTLSDRFDYLMERYGTTEERRIRLKEYYREIRLIECMIFSDLPMEPVEINRLNAVDPEDANEMSGKSAVAHDGIDKRNCHVP